MDAKGNRAGGRGGRSGGVPGEVWLREPRARRDALTLDRIVATAVDLLDADGVAGLTMRRLADRLAVAPPTLYWHVKTKDDVLDLAVDAIFAEVPVPSGPWRDAVRELVLAWRATMLRHPWSPPLLGRPALGPNVLERTEFLQGALASAGFTGAHLAAATHGLANFVIGSALTQSTWHSPEALGTARAHLRARADDYPTLVANDHLADQDWDALFERGLDHFLTGLAQGIGSGPVSSPP
ncbi:TetR/AcrR family transcriptional regulator C-terminal domain-containing protein [Saccharothrix xinjiangensis]|uniref:TetR/AcrR family transcriptional regulator C-terminal domain-containing protein n=1 Tax=Saccharothrix xinjiangensis TaxID=204798 RepID=A0ABV9YBN0_9PSEU